MIRTVRRFLERYGNKVDALLFVFANKEERRPYDKVRLDFRAFYSVLCFTPQREVLVRCCNVLFAAAADLAAVLSAEQGRAVQSGGTAAKGCRK